MKRRDLLKSAAGASAAGALAGLLIPASAHADGEDDTPSYSVAGTEQVQNKIMIWHKDDAFTDANLAWSWSPGVGGWYNLSDVRFRSTWAYGEVALVAASGGNVGIVNKTRDRHQGLDALLWTGEPGGNPHAAERIPGLGAVVTASSSNGKVEGGYLCVYGPRVASRPGTLELVQVLPFKGAHGVLWDPRERVLWAIGDKALRVLRVTGGHRRTRVEDTGRVIPLDGLGHDLQPDYSDPGKLFITDTYGAYHIDKATMTRTMVEEGRLIKAYSRHHSGEDVSVQADDTGERTWGSPTIRFSRSPWRTREGAEFYKARVHTTAFA